MSSKVYEALFQDIDRHMDEYMGELCDFLRIPGVSTYPDGRENMEKAAEWILEKLRTLGFEGGLRQTEGCHGGAHVPPRCAPASDLRPLRRSAGDAGGGVDLPTV